MSKDNLLCPHCFAVMKDQTDEPCAACGLPPTAQSSALYLPTGTLLRGQYRIGKVLGHGGFGVTYLALDEYLQTKCAIKEFLPRELVTRDSDHITIVPYSGEAQENFSYGLEKFLEEAKTLARFQDHACIVAAKSFFSENSTAYLVMQYLDGMSLKRYLAEQGGKIPYTLALDILLPVMDALREAHRLGILQIQTERLKGFMVS